MNSIDRWLTRQSFKEKKIPSLVDSLITNKISAYILYRLRFLSTRIFVELLITIIEFTFFFHLLKREHVQVLLLAKIATVLFGAFIWGALELVRTRLRNFMNAGRRVRVKVEIRNWLFLAGAVSGFMLAVSIAYLIFTVTDGKGLNYVELYVFASLIKISLDIFARTFHSCVYAISRIFRPLFVIVVFQLVLFVGALILWNFISYWSLPIMQLFVSVLLSSIMIYYTNLQYKRLKLPSEKLTSSIMFPKIRLKEFAFGTMTGISNMLLQLETILVLVLLRSGQMNIHFINYALFFFLLSPLLKGSFDWARLFYFDYKRIEVGVFSNFRSQLNRYLNVVSLIVAIVFWAISIVVALYFFGSHNIKFNLVLLLVFLARSALGSYQIRAFSNSKYIELFISESIFIFSIFLLFTSYSTINIVNILLAIAAIEFISIAPILLMNLSPIRIWQDNYIYAFTEWLNLVKNFKGQCRAGIIEFNIEKEQNMIQQKATLLKKKMGKKAIISCINYKTLAFLERKSENEITKNDLFIVFSGTIKNIYLSDFSIDGSTALSAIDFIISRDKLDESDLIRKFKKTFPNGYVVTIGDQIQNQKIKNMMPYERRIFFNEAIRYSKGIPRGSYKFPYLVSSFCPKGELKLIFLVHKTAEPNKLNAWLEFINKANYSESIR